MKTIKIFIASSNELEKERVLMASLANELSTRLEKVGIQVIAVEWESLDSSMNEEHKQEEYNKKLRECDMCMVLYWTRFGMYTEKELNTAYHEKIAGKNPQKVWVYFKEIDDPSNMPTEELKKFRDSFPTKYGHFYTPFANFDTLKAHFLLQFMEYQSQALQGKSIVEVKDGKVIVDSKEYVDLQNVPFAGNNEEYQLLQKNLKKTRKLLAVTEMDDPEYVEYATEIEEMEEKLTKMESSLWDTALMITKLSTTKCSERLQRAILNEEEIAKDVQHNLNLIKLGEEGKKGLKTNIDEYLLKIQTYENEMEEGWEDKIIYLYEKCIDLGRNRIDDCKNAELLSDYADFLFFQHRYNRVEEIYTEALSLYRIINKTSDIDYEPCIIYCLKQLSLHYIYSNEYENAEKALNEILLSQKEDGEEDEQLRFAEATALLAYLHYNQLQYEKALEECEKAISKYSQYEWVYKFCESLYIRGIIHKDMGKNDLAEKDALEMLDYIEKFEIDGLISSAYNLLGNAYNNQLKFDLAINAYQKAQDNLEEKSRNNPHPYLQEIAGNYSNLGRMHRLTGQYNAAYDDFNKARNILQTLVNQDPLQNSESYIRCLYSLSDLCKETKQYEEAEGYINEAIDCSRALSKTDAERHLFDLAHSLNIKGIILYEQNKYEDAERTYLESLDIRRKIVADFGDKYLERVAQILSNLGLLHCEMRKFEDAENDYQEALCIYKKIISEYGLKKGEDITFTLLNLGYLNRCKFNWQKAIEYYQESIDVLNEGFEKSLVRDTIVALQIISRNYVGIGYCQRTLKHFDYALESFKRAVNVISEHYNEENKILFALDYSTALNECAWSLYEMKDFGKAEPFATKAVENIRLHPESRNPLRMFLDTLACIHRGLGKYNESEKEFIECISIAEELYNQNPELNVLGLYNELKELAFLYFEMKDQDKFNQYKSKASHYYNELNEEVKKEREEDYKKLESMSI